MSSRRSKHNDTDDDFVSFAALHTKVTDSKKLSKAPRPAFTYWDYDPSSKASSVSPVVSKNRDVDVVSGLNNRLKRLSADLSAPSGFDSKWRRKLKKNRELEATSPSTSGNLARWNSTSNVDDYTRPSKKYADIDFSSERLGSKMAELRDLVAMTEMQSAMRTSQPRHESAERSTLAQAAYTSAVPEYGSRSYKGFGSRRSSSQSVFGSSLGGKGRNMFEDLDPDSLYSSSFTVNVNPPLNEQEVLAEAADAKPYRPFDNITRKLVSQELQKNKTNNKKEEIKFNSADKGFDQDSSPVIHEILERLKNPQPSASATKPAVCRHNDDGSRAELAIFAAQINDLSLPPYVDRGREEDFWTRMAHNKGERAQLEQLVGHAFDKSRTYHNHTYPGFELRTPELELFPAASLARRWTHDRVKTT